MKSFLKVVSSNTARVIKALVGVYFLLLGVLYPDQYGLALAFGGAFFLLSGLMDFCLLAPLFGYPFLGHELRAALKDKVSKKKTLKNKKGKR